MDQLVIGGAQYRITGAGAEAAAVDQGLRVFNAEAEGEWFGFDVDTTVVQHLESITRAVADRQHDMVGHDCFAAGEHDRTHLALVVFPFDVDVLDFLLEAELAAQCFDAGAHLLHHLDQPESADMRLADVHDLVRRIGLDEFGQHLAAVMLRVFDLGPELAVGKRPGAAFTELDVGFRL